MYTLLRISGAVLLPLISIVITYISKDVINLLVSALYTREMINSLLFLFAILLLVTLLRKAIQTITQYSQIMHGELLNGEISLMIMDTSLNCDLEYFDNPSFNDKLAVANQDSHAIANILWNAISSVSALVSFACAFIVICQKNVFYGIILLFSAIPSSLVSAKYTRSLYRLSVEQINDQRQMGYTQSLSSDKHYAQEIRLFDMGKWLKQRYTNILQKLLVERKKMNRKRVLIMGVLECLPEGIITLISIDIAFNILDGNATIGDYILYTGLIAQLWNAVYALASSVMEIYSNRLRIENMKLLSQFENHVKDCGNLKLNEVKTITFDKVCFTYPGAAYSTLNDVSFNLCKEEKVALVGLNGSGKSTLIKLLLRMYDPNSGTIYINDVDIKKYKISELRSNFSVYFQEMMNYSFTIRENFEITDTDLEASDVLIEHALADAYFTDLLDRSPKRCDASLMRYFDPEGIELSGGQFQKLALARVFYRKHSALILDEPSSNLDPKAEKKIFESIQTIARNKMTIFTSHHLSNIYLADRIIVLENGKVVEDGTHKELLKNNKFYAELFHYKSEKYKSM
jgi:ABC-type multidrug transport system, ATPase and permease components